MRYTFLFILLFTFSSQADINPSLLKQKVPDGSAQLNSALEWFSAGKSSDGLEIKYCGQKETNGKLRLTASNGYFSSGIRAKGESKFPFKKTEFITNNYEFLENWNKKGQSLRWHMFFQKTGSVVLNVELSPLSSGSIIKASINGASVTFEAEKGKNNYRLVLPVKKRGKNTLSLSLEKVNGRQTGKLFGIDVFGPATVGAKLLRARWRPGAVHAGFTSSVSKGSHVWVMSSKSLNINSSYSPITTPFGYYGTSFDEEKKAKKIMNFSMWSKLDVPLEQMTHLIGVGSLKADFGGFGHEGTGVKLRGNWEPLAHRPEILTQALRVEYDDKYATYYGYFLDANGDWKFFCSGKKWLKSKKGRKALWPGAFVEVPGPPNVQRSGDQLREVHRQGWSMDSENKWHPIDLMSQGKAANKNKSWGVSSDGWFIMKMGGMEHHDYPSSNKLKIDTPSSLPDFLKPEKAMQLFKTPVSFGEIKVSKISDIKALVSFDLKDAGPNAKAIVYYGEKDYLTFAPRKLHGTEKKSSVLNESGTWTNSIELKSVIKGDNKIAVRLKQNVKYWFRILIINENGRQWSNKSLRL